MYKIVITLLFCSIAISNGQTLKLSGNDWKIKDVPNKDGKLLCNDWIPAIVPGNIQADLEVSRYLKPLWYGEGEPRMHELH